MELVRELFATAGIALIFSIIVAKLVSMAMAADSKPAVQVDDETIAEELKSAENLEVRGSVIGTRVQSVEETAEIVEKLEENTVFDDDAPELRSESGEVEVELKSAVNSGDIVEDKVERTGVEEYMEELKDQIDLVSDSQETGVEVQPEGLVSLVKEEEKSVGDIEDDWVWEGIATTELEKEFAAAVKFVESPGNVESLGNDLLIELYGLHKIATEGPCGGSPPMLLKLSSRAKCDGRHCLHCARNAWQRLGNMNPEQAMVKYISLLSHEVPRWTDQGIHSERESEAEYCAESGNSGPTSTDMSSSPIPCTTTGVRYPELIPAANNATGDSEVEDQVKD